jgi:hypothetical protein
MRARLCEEWPNEIKGHNAVLAFRDRSLSQPQGGSSGHFFAIRRAAQYFFILALTARRAAADQ